MLALASCVALLAADPAKFSARTVEVPGAIEETAVPESIQTMGVPVRLRAVRSKEKLGVLMEYFHQKLVDADLYVPGDGELRNPGGLVHVTGWDFVARNSVSVLFQPNQDGTITVVLGEAYFHAEKRQAPAPFAPVFPGGAGLVVANLEIGQTQSYSAKATPEELTTFYRETLKSAGYEETGSGQFTGRAGKLRLWLKPHGAGETGVVVVKSGGP
jgi:hypothetical protein